MAMDCFSKRPMGLWKEITPVSFDGFIGARSKSIRLIEGGTSPVSFLLNLLRVWGIFLCCFVFLRKPCLVYNVYLRDFFFLPNSHYAGCPHWGGSFLTYILYIYTIILSVSDPETHFHDLLFRFCLRHLHHRRHHPYNPFLNRFGL